MSSIKEETFLLTENKCLLTDRQHLSNKQYNTEFISQNSFIIRAQIKKTNYFNNRNNYLYLLNYLLFFY